MKCEVCEATATVHVTDVESDGSARSRSLCEHHASQAGYSPTTFPIDPVILEAVSSTNRKLADFLRTHRRMPKGDEAIPICGSEVGLPRLGANIDIDAYIEYLDVTADFVDRNGRYPTEDEVPGLP